MSTGYARCCGSSLFLKRLYGVGYTFVISLNIGCDPVESKQKIDEIVLQSIEGSSLVNAAGGEISYRLPFDQQAAFPSTFEALDKIKEETGISTYGISITTLEEVFLKIGEEHKSEIEGSDEGGPGSSPSSNPFPDHDAIKLERSDMSKRLLSEEKVEENTVHIGVPQNHNEEEKRQHHSRDYEQIEEVRCILSDYHDANFQFRLFLTITNRTTN